MKFVRDLFTESDGVTWDLGRVSWFAGFLTLVGMTIWQHDKFEPATFGAGLGAVMAAGGLMIWAKSKES